MHPRLVELAAYLELERTNLEAAVALIPASRRNERPRPDAWSVAEVIEHVAKVEKGATRLLQVQCAEARAKGLGADADTSPILPTMDHRRALDRSNRIEAPERVRPTGTLDAESAWSQLAAGRQALMATIESADGLALGQLRYPHTVFGDMTLYEWLGLLGAHDNRHAQQLREMADVLG